MIDQGIISNSIAQSNQILSMKYLWARRHYKRGVANHWVPESISMRADQEQWKSNELSQEEQLIVMRNLGFLSAFSPLVANNVVLVTYRYVTNPECRQCLLCQAYECMVHTDAVIYCCDSLRLDTEVIQNMYKTVPAMKAKFDFVCAFANPLRDVTTTLKSKKDIQQFLKEMIRFYLIMQGIFFYSGCAMMCALKRDHKLVGMSEQFAYILRDVGLHCSFGFDLINTIKAEYPDVWTVQMQQDVIDVIKQAVELEKVSIMNEHTTNILDITAQQRCQYVEYVADWRLERIDLASQYHQKNPFSWMQPSLEFEIEESFFDTRGAEYQRVETVEWE